jgi:transcription antitermination protein NusB
MPARIAKPTRSTLPQPTKPRNRTPQTSPVNKRGAARLAAVQALYQMDVAGTGVLETAAEYENFRLGQEIDGEQYLAADAQWFRGILAGVVEHQKQLDPIIHGALEGGWPLSRLDSTLRAILRAGAFEMLHRADVPAAVIITEYVEIATAFFAEDEPKMVTAVLDRIGKQARV